MKGTFTDLWGQILCLIYTHNVAIDKKCIKNQIKKYIKLNVSAHSKFFFDQNLLIDR